MTDSDTNRRRFFWLIAPIGVALGCIIAATLVSTAEWTDIFSHPARVPAPETTRQGAAIWKIMLFIGAAALVGAPLLLNRLSRASTVERSSPASNTDRRTFALLLVIVVVAVLARATRIGESLWYDEISAWGSYGVHGPGAILGNYFDPANHVAHTMLTWVSMTLLGADDFALRLPALIFSIASVLVLFGLTNHVAGPRVGLLAAAIGATMPVMVLEGAEARGYSMMICFSALATWALLSARDHDRPWQWCLYAGLCALGAWSHPMTGFVPVGHFIWMTWCAVRSREVHQWIMGTVALGLAAIVTVTLYAPIVPDVLAMRETLRATTADQPQLWGVEGYHGLLQFGGSWYWWASAPGLLLTGIGLADSIRHRDRRRAVAGTLVGLVAMILLVAASGTWVYARFALFALPGFILLIAFGIDRLWRWHRLAGRLCLLVLLVLAAADLSVRPPKQPLREAASNVAQHQVTGDRVVVIGLVHQVFNAYAGGLDISYSLHHGADLPRVLDQVQPQWIVMYYPGRVSREHTTMLADRGFRLTAQFEGWVDWGHGDVRVYRREKAAD